MMFRPVSAAAALALVLADAGAAAATLDPGAWTIGPVIRVQNYSRLMPLHPSPGPGRGFHIALPQAPGSLHYVTFRHGSLTDKSRIVMRYRIEAAPGVQVVPRTAPQMPAQITLYFQRAGDSWKGRTHELFRWYAPLATVQAVRPGVHQMTVSFSDPSWISVFGKPASGNGRAFAVAMAESSRVGLVFGSSGARGHGVYATAPARFTLIDFAIS